MSQGAGRPQTPPWRLASRPGVSRPAVRGRRRLRHRHRGLGQQPAAGLTVPVAYTRGEERDQAMCARCSPRPACGERVPKAGEGRRRRRALSWRDASSAAMPGRRAWRDSVVRERTASARPSSALRAPSPRARGEGRSTWRAGMDHGWVRLVFLRPNQKGALSERVASFTRFGSWRTREIFFNAQSSRVRRRGRFVRARGSKLS